MKTRFDLERLYRYVEENPGSTKAEIVRLSGVRSRSAESVLGTLERYGWLLSEDQSGKLYAFLEVKK